MLPNPKKEPIKYTKSYMQYSDIAFRMGGIILLGTLFGKQLDKWLHFERPIMTLVFCLLSVFGAIYMIIKTLDSKK